MGRKKRTDGDGGVWYDTRQKKWIGSVTIGQYADGRPKLRRASADTEKAAARKVRDLQRDLTNGILRDGKTPTVRQWFDYWVPNVCEPRVRPGTMRGYDTVIQTWILPHLGKWRLDKLKAEHIYAMRAAMAKAPPARKGGKIGRAPTYVNQVLAILHVALEDAVAHEKVHRNVCSLVDRPQLSDVPAGYLPAVHAKKVLKLVHDDRLAARWAVGLVVGVRQGEALGLAFRIKFLDNGEEWSAFDPDARTLKIAWELQRDYAKHGCGDTDEETGKRPCGRRKAGNCPEVVNGGMYLTRPKSRKSRRTLGLDPIMVAELKHRRTLSKRERIEAGPRWQPWITTAEGRPCEVELMFSQESGRPIDPSKDSKTWHALLTQAEAPRIRPHGARHSAASIMIDRGASLRQVMETLGHSQFGITARLYTHLEQQATREAIGGAAGAVFNAARPDPEEMTG